MTRRYLTFVVIALMTISLIFSLVSRARTPHDAPAEVLVPSVDAGDAGDGGDAGVLEAGVAADAAPSVAPPPVVVARPLRVTTLGWELAAPAVVLAKPDAGASSSVELLPEATEDGVFARLARGGEDVTGADVAIVPLASMVAAYERVRALDPRAFAVVGFSRGREEFRASTLPVSKASVATGDVLLVGMGPAMASDPAAKASSSTAATMLGLFALDELGVAPSRVRILSPGAADAKAAPFAAVLKGAPDPRRLAFSTADASHFAPFVMVAAKATLEKDATKLRDFAHGWLDAAARAKADGSDVARRLSTKEGIALGAGVDAAPDALTLLERMGQVEPVPVAEEGRWIGPHARSSLTLATLMARTWQLARGAGYATASAPDPLPIDARVLEGDPAPPPSASSAPPDADAGAFLTVPAKASELLAYRAIDPSADVASVSAEVAFLSEVFDRAVLRVSAKGGEKVARAIATSAGATFGVPATRLATTKAEPVGAFAVVEILALP